MSKTTHLLLTLSVITLFSLGFAHSYGEYHECQHDSVEFNPEIADVDEGIIITEGRLLKKVSISVSTSSSGTKVTTSSSSSSSSSTSTSTSSGSSSTSTKVTVGVSTGTNSGNNNNSTNTTQPETPEPEPEIPEEEPEIPEDDPEASEEEPESPPESEEPETSEPEPEPEVPEPEPEKPDEPEEPIEVTPTYPNLRIYAHYDSITEGSDEFKAYVGEELLPPVVSLLQAALKLKYPLTSPLKVTQKTLCGITTPAALTTAGDGIETDFVILFTSSNGTGSSWVASASNCLVSSGVRRPLVAKVSLNFAVIKPTTLEENPLRHEFNTYVLLHEMLHGLGFSKNFFNNYIDNEGNLLKNHIKQISLAGNTRTVVDLPPLTERLRNFYGCPSLPGAFMEDDGGSGTSGSHWERRFFPFDLLSSGAIHGRRLTEFTLAYLEGTGWYAPDYTYAEPFYFGQGAGCDFIYGNCTTAAEDVAEYSEHCTGNGRGCTNIGRGGGFCKTDVCTDGCRFVSPQFEYDCENPSGIYYTPFSSKQSYGREAGSKCFSGNLTTTSNTVSKTTYCFKHNCIGSGADTQLEVMFGTTKLICEKKGPLTVKGYKGTIDCPDPLEFCSTIGKKYCPRGCMGRGQCVDNKCVCNAGFKGIDCAFRDI